jgi:hypothetical protein
MSVHLALQSSLDIPTCLEGMAPALEAGRKLHWCGEFSLY